MFARRSIHRVGTALFFASCAMSCGSTGSYPGRAAAPVEQAVISVTNNNWSDVKIYAIRGTSKIRLGSVTSFSTAQLRLPPGVAATNDLQLRVELIGSSESYTTERLLVRRGDRMDWTIHSHLPLSRLAIR